MSAETKRLLLLGDLQAMPRLEAGAVVTIRSYRPGDLPPWEELLSEQRGGEIEVSFEENLRGDPAYRPYRTVFVLENDRAVATATAGYDPRVMPTAGRLCFVAASKRPDATNLARLACISALEVMLRENRTAAWAEETGIPLIDRVLAELGFAKTDVSVPEVFHDHTDYQGRTISLRRWFDRRGIGESTGSTGDARGDETLYRPSDLGRASIDFESVRAGENRPFSLTYTVGKYPLLTGASVKFWMAGQGSLGTAPQIADPESPGFVECHGPEDVELEVICDKVRVLSLETGENPPGGLRGGELVVGPITIGFALKGGALREGDRVRFDVGRQSGFIWKRLADRKEFKVMVDPGRGEPRMRLPEPVKVNILPLEADHLEVLLPATARPGDEVEATVTVRDRYDNRVAFDGTAEIVYRDATGGPYSPGPAADVGPAYLSEGKGRIKAGALGSGGLRIEARCEAASGVSASNPCVPSADYQLFVGDMHTHDSQSTAEGYPADCYTWARDEKRLDFQALPIQVHRWLDNEKWTIGKHMNEYFLDEGKFVTFLSFEWQHSQYGDKVIHYLGGDMPYLPIDDPRYADPMGLYEALGGTEAFIVSHHPGYELDLHVPGTRWETVDTGIDRLAEIWSMHGSSEGFDPDDRPVVPPRRPGGVYDGLRQGVRMGLVGGSDTHTARPGGSVGEPRPYYGGLCAVWAEELTRRSLFEAFMARRTYALTGARIVLRFTVNDAPMGSECELTETRRLVAQVWAPDAIDKIQMLGNTDLLAEFPSGKQHETIEYVDKRATACFYHCRVVLRNGEMAVCSPVWVG